MLFMRAERVVHFVMRHMRCTVLPFDLICSPYILNVIILHFLCNESYCPNLIELSNIFKQFKCSQFNINPMTLSFEVRKDIVFLIFNHL